MTKKSKILFAVVACVVVALVSLFVGLRIYVNNQQKVNLTDDQVRQMIDTALPRGTARSAVRNFLTTQRWEHRDDGFTTQAMIRDAKHNFLIRKDIQVQFHFDPNDRLISYELKAFLTGP